MSRHSSAERSDIEGSRVVVAGTANGLFDFAGMKMD